MTSDKRHISLVFIGHVDSGKSTTAGHLLQKCGGIDATKMKECEQQAVLQGKENSRFAWLMDQLPHEREGGYSIDISRRQCESPKYKLTVVDAPGHVDFLKNTITGMAQADAAVLVVDAVSFEENMAKDGQAKEHILLAYTLGVKQMIVAINKLDDPTVKFAEERYKSIRDELCVYLRKVGYKPMKIPFIPISGLGGDNMTEPSVSLPWYTGSTLVEAIDNVNPPKRSVEKPLRIPVQDVIKKDEEGNSLVAIGRVETGLAKPGMRVMLAPSGTIAEIESLEMHHEKLQEARPGDQVGLRIVGNDLTPTSLKRGDVISDAQVSPASGVTRFQAQVIVMNHPGRISQGYTPVIDVHTAHVACKFAQIHQKIDRRTGKVLEINPQSIQSGEACLVDLEPIKPLCVEAFADFAPLGRFAIRDMQQTVAVGVIKSIVTREDHTNNTNAST